MKKTFLGASFLLFFTLANAQDKLILINGDTLSGKILKIGADDVSVMVDDIEHTLRIDFLSKLIYQNGKSMVFSEIKTFDFTDNLVTLEYSPGIERQVKQLFPRAIKREITKAWLDGHTPSSISFYFTEDAPGMDVTDRIGVDNYKLLGGACNAFLGLVAQTDDGYKYTFFFNPINGKQLSLTMLNKTYKLTSSTASSKVVNAIDNATLKPFKMTMKENNQCIFMEENKELLLEYTVSDQGEINFKDPKRKNNGTSYQVVYFNDEYIRYTQFSSGPSLLTRRVDVVKE